MRHHGIPLCALLAICGSLAAQSYSSSTASAVAIPNDIVVALDWNQDGADDLVLQQPTTPPAMATGFLSGFFTNPASLGAAAPTITGLTGLSSFYREPTLAANIDNDGIPDLLFRTIGASGRAWFGVTGSGTGSGTSVRPIMTGDGGSSADVGDMNGDGRDELVLFFRSPLSGPGGPLPPPAILRVFDLSTSPATLLLDQAVPSVVAPMQVVVGDWNGDGLADALIGGANYDPATDTSPAMLVLGQAAAAPIVAGAPPFVFANVTATLFSLHAGDVNGDGFDDVVRTAMTPSGGAFFVPLVETYFGSPIGLATTPAVTIHTPNVSVVLGRGLFDFDSDGCDDLLLASSTSVSSGATFQAALHVVRGTASGFGFVTQDIPSVVGSSSFVPAPIVGDFDGDGDCDIVVRVPIATGGTATTLIENSSIFGAPCTGIGGEPRLIFGTASPTNSAFGYALDGAAPNSLAVFLVSTGRSGGGIGCGIHVDLSPGALLLLNGGLTIVPTDPFGRFSGVINLNPIVGLSGATLFYQAAVVDPQGSFSAAGLSFALSRGRAVTFF